MFFEEVQPFVREFFAEPIAFLGGFASGVLKVDLAQDPVKSWLDKEAGATGSDDDNTPPPPSGPQTISID
ncbi:MAG: hypothetical protein ACFB9N_02205 [Geitlerinemataceae cyanobacterium]